MRHLSLLLVALSVPSALTADEMLVRDLRVDLGAGGIAGYERTVDYTAGINSATPTGTYTTNHYDGSAPIFAAVSYTGGRLGGFGGFLWSAGVEASQSHDTVSGERLTFSTFSARLRAGWGYAFTHRIHIEVMPELQLGGTADQQVDVTSSGYRDRSTAAGSIEAIGLHVGGMFRLNHGFLLGLSLRAMSVYTQASDSFYVTGGDYDAHASYTVLSAAGTLGWRF